jgi:hypothetical protein
VSQLIKIEGYLVKNYSAENIIDLLKLEAHPEGGFYRQTFKDKNCDSNGRSLSSVIYYLLKYDQASHWHRVDATECWFWHSGAPLVISMSSDGHDVEAQHLGPDILTYQKPHVIVPEMYWQAAVSLGEWSLVSCMVSPSFEFSGFELAEENWYPKPREPLNQKP